MSLTLVSRTRPRERLGDGQEAEGGDAEAAAVRKEELRAKMMEKARDGKRWHNISHR